VESEQRFDLIADLPGVSVNDIDISIERGVLRLRGERAGVTASEDDERYLRRSERRNGTFERLFSLPDNVDADNVSAHAKHGVVTISIHKKPEPVAKRIEVTLAN
jgi:HSP20 family protein